MRINDKDFWKIIEKVKDSANPEILLKDELMKLSPRGLVIFRMYLDVFFFKADQDELWRAAHIIHGYCSDDGFQYFRDGLIARGEEIYKKAIETPDSLADIDPMVEKNELFGDVVYQVYEEKTGEPMSLKEVSRDEWPPEVHEMLSTLNTPFGFLRPTLDFREKENMKHLPKLMQKFGSNPPVISQLDMMMKEEIQRYQPLLNRKMIT